MTEASSTPRDLRRPGSTNAVMLATAAGVIDIVGGSMVLVLATSAAPQPNAVPGGLATAITIIIAGVIVVVAASRLRRGNRTARMLVSVVRIISIVAQIVVASTGGLGLVVAIASLLISMILLGWLWVPRARRTVAQSSV